MPVMIQVGPRVLTSMAHIRLYVATALMLRIIMYVQDNSIMSYIGYAIPHSRYHYTQRREQSGTSNRPRLRRVQQHKVNASR